MIALPVKGGALQNQTIQDCLHALAPLVPPGWRFTPRYPRNTKRRRQAIIGGLLMLLSTPLLAYQLVFGAAALCFLLAASGMLFVKR